MEDALLCKLCFNVFEEPVLLSCNHSVCFACAEKLFLLKQTEFLNPKRHSLKAAKILSPSASLEPETININCPTCNTATSLDVEKGMKQLKKNLEIVSALEARTAGNVCEMECGRKATCECSKCEVRMCDKCFAEEHNKSALLKKHAKLPIAHQYNVKDCALHHEKIAGFCTQCKAAICNNCFDDGHKGHNKCITMVQYKLLATAQIEAVQGKMKDTKQKFEMFDKLLDEKIVKVQNSHKNSVTMINEAFATVVTALDKRRQHLVSNSNALKELIESELVTQKKINDCVLKNLQSSLQEDAATKTDIIDLGFTLQKLLTFNRQLDEQQKYIEKAIFTELVTKINVEPLLAGIEATGFCVSCVPPSKITTFTKVEGVSKLLKLKWEEPFNGGSIILGYQVHIQGEDKEKTVDVTEAQYSETAERGVLHIKVRAQNDLGFGEWSDVIKVDIKGTLLSFTQSQDKNGLLNYLGSNFKSKPFSNSDLLSKVKFTSEGSAYCSFLGGSPTISRHGQRPANQNWVCFKLEKQRFVPNYFSLTFEQEPAGWKLLASCEGMHWVPLKEYESTDIHKKTINAWPIPNSTTPYRYFKISGQGHLGITSFELYGELI